MHDHNCGNRTWQLSFLHRPTVRLTPLAPACARGVDGHSANKLLHPHQVKFASPGAGDEVRRSFCLATRLSSS